MKKIFPIVLTSACAFAGASASADTKYNLNRTTTSGACHIQLSTSLPQIGVLLEAFDTQKAACDKALTLKTDDVTETDKCVEYTKGAKKDCKAEGVELP
ncbi:MAG: hypothetical protein GJ676_05680 [Rhodobacteraceae bacterium]|nr:hypothetical protein [Paracoccaceae bacterium]